MSQVFISYSRRDLSFVKSLVDDLKEAGYDVWYDLSELEGGSRWGKEIQNAIQNSQYIITVLSPDSVASEWVEREFLYASKLKLKIIPLFYRECELPLNYLNLNYIDVQGGNYRQNFNKILSALSDRPVSTNTNSTVPMKFSWTGWTIGVMLFIVVGLGFAVYSVIFRPGFPIISPTEMIMPIKTSTPTQQIATSSSLEPSLTPAETVVVPDKSTHDGAKLIYIPEGEFVRGLSEEQLSLIISLCPDCKRDYVDDEMPQTSIYLDSFWIDEKEVTNAQFARFVDETGYITSAEKKLNDATYVFDLRIKDFVFTPDADWQHPHGKSSNINGLDTLPVTQVSWDDAYAYCTWAGRRLPTEAEWEKAARGTDGALFVWGNEPPSGQLLNFNLQFQGPRPVGSYNMGVSPYGIYDMAGNVWEWVSDYYSESYFQIAPDKNPSGPISGDGHVLRGGSWASEFKDLYLVTATSRIWNWSYTRSDVLGIRCAVTATP